jgi:hypothetical protein
MSSATYLITGDARAERAHNDGTDQDINMEYEYEDDSEEEVPLVKSALVGEAALEGTLYMIHTLSQT